MSLGLFSQCGAGTFRQPPRAIGAHGLIFSLNIEPQKPLPSALSSFKMQHLLLLFCFPLPIQNLVHTVLLTVHVYWCCNRGETVGVRFISEAQSHLRPSARLPSSFILRQIQKKTRDQSLPYLTMHPSIWCCSWISCHVRLKVGSWILPSWLTFFHQWNWSWQISLNVIRIQFPLKP